MQSPLPSTGVFVQMIGALLFLIGLFLGLASLGSKSVVSLLIALGLMGVAIGLVHWGRQTGRPG